MIFLDPIRARKAVFIDFSNPSKFPPVWPVPIETPKVSLQSLIPPYWPSTHLTCPILTWDISIHHTFLSGIASPYTKHIFSIFEIILPYRKFSIQLRHTHWTGPRGLEHFFVGKLCERPIEMVESRCSNPRGPEILLGPETK